MSRGRGRPLFAWVALALGATGGWTAPAEPPPDLPRHQLVFVRHADAARSDYDIWRICADGTQLSSLVVAPGRQLQVAVSPDGSELAWASHDGEERDIWRRPFTGGEPVRVTDHPADDQDPVFSPDGRRLSFFSTRDHEKPELYVVELADGAIERLTDNAFYDSGASWSPDGSRIVFTRFFPAGEPDHGGDGEVFEIELASRRERRITELGGYNGGLSYSPDGSRIAFHRVAEGRAELWLMAADGSGARPITDTFVDEYSPAWSPDGEWLAFTAGTGNDSRGAFDLFLIRPDGSGRRLVTAGANTDAWPEWRPGEHHCR